MALPEDSVSCVMLSVWCGMKQDSAESPPRYLPAPPESDHFLAVEEQQREALLGVLDVRQLADRRARLAAGGDAVAACEKAPIAPPIGSTSR